jgi:hypothetical protein
VKKRHPVKNILLTGILMALGLIILKYIPMYIWGKNILFDASAHLTITIFILYIGYFFLSRRTNLHPVYFLFCLSAITIVSLQRIISNAHNDIGLLLGLILSTASIAIANWKIKEF